MPDAVTLRYWLLSGSAIFLSAAIFLCFIRLALGPRYTDRILAANMIVTKIIILLAVLSVIIGQDYLADICLVCSTVGFLSVIVLSRSVLENKEGREE